MLREGGGLEGKGDEIGGVGELFPFLEFVEGVTDPLFLTAANLLQLLIASLCFLSILALSQNLSP